MQIHQSARLAGSSLINERDLLYSNVEWLVTFFICFRKLLFLQGKYDISVLVDSYNSHRDAVSAPVRPFPPDFSPKGIP